MLTIFMIRPFVVPMNKTSYDWPSGDMTCESIAISRNVAGFLNEIENENENQLLLLAGVTFLHNVGLHKDWFFAKECWDSFVHDTVAFDEAKA